MQNKPHEGKNKKCGAKTRKGTPCKNPAGFRTYHVGEGRCYLHGGLSTGPKDKSKLKGNKNAEKHGFFSKYLPEETMDLIQEINEKDPLDILWENIQIQYAAIIRSQRIMHVGSKEEMIKELKKEKKYGSETVTSSETEYEFQFAWDRQATFLQAQSRAMAELRNMIAKYDELCKSELATEEQKLRIRKLKVDIEKVEGNEDELNKLDKLIEAIDHEAKS